MSQRLDGRSHLRTFLFIACFLLAGVANLLSRLTYPEVGAALSLSNYLAYIGLLLFWIQSVRARLLPSRARSQTICAALMMLMYCLLRVFKYSCAVEPTVERYAVYLYFVPITMIPTLFLMTCLRIRRGNQPGRWNEALLLIPPALLSLTALTNDLHLLVYMPSVELSAFIVKTGTYTGGPAYWLLYGWIDLSLGPG